MMNLHEDEQLRCKICGFVRDWFRRWSFTGDKCSGEQNGTKAMLHNWELISKETTGE